ncbi:TPA_asm: RNA-directed RNA polymerase [ssRNA phage SRR6960799_22]|uniref:RNA-directed RNA polymerase n=1 Tax=ssRNA phage SRR6960799_22 TaxID=2786579 RepID=A0A8S5L521_9VIRU|nr:RNA-directed RNA polymerase [ssRNA phage SRR6960799_22]DAD52298.1 TPA_asm: RNA-directed RNA polymerase [ssRNA phage SRR6960799_22]
MPVTGLTQDVQAVVLSLMEGLATPRALTVSILLRYGEWGEIFRL